MTAVSSEIGKTGDRPVLPVCSGKIECFLSGRHAYLKGQVELAKC